MVCISVAVLHPLVILVYVEALLASPVPAVLVLAVLWDFVVPVGFILDLVAGTAL